ncbi:uncharacterized protein TNIN_177181 [Trichonephila inaurata madagascariensis]|uniref:Uncharacterized protein n=1 Tax=Trichonephila inaurata madagascariensis TaxID=2747483 RepID=A0A8X6Y0J1_9ARAC|nr:uncharacterized protein TNIN_177181 [Trichonephila inaurata madagascariensis]
MSKDFWINPCGFENDKTDFCEKENVPEEMDDLVKKIKAFLNQFKSLQKILAEEFPAVDEESLQSQKYSFLESKYSTKENKYVYAYRMLQITAMTIEELLGSKLSYISPNSYFENLSDTKTTIIQLLCSVNNVLKSQCEKYVDMDKSHMSRPFTNGSQKAERHFIAIRQIIKIFEELLDLFSSVNRI